jgi:hypothetical protein
MRLGLTVAVVGAAAASASTAMAAPSLEIRGAAARVTVVAETRPDIAVALLRADPRLPIRIRKLGDRVYVTGDVGHRVHGCQLAPGVRGAAIWGRGAIPLEQLPHIFIRAPLGVRITAGDAVFGEIGRSASVDLTNLGCGDWTIANVQGRLRLSQASAGSARTGTAGSADLSATGDGVIAVGAVGAGLTAVSSGSGSIAVASVAGPLDARVAGSGDIDLQSGSVTRMTVSIAGSGTVRLKGTAQSLRASIAGSGDVSVSKVTGAVTRQIFGPGAIRVGR